MNSETRIEFMSEPSYKSNDGHLKNTCIIVTSYEYSPGVIHSDKRMRLPISALQAALLFQSWSKYEIIFASTFSNS